MKDNNEKSDFWRMLDEDIAKHNAMSNDKQSSVEWFADEEHNLFISYQKGFMSTARYILLKHNLQKQAKAMHKEEIKNAWYNSLTKADYLSANEYYNETFEK